MSFEWSPDFWQGWREAANPYRRFKSERDRALTVKELQLKDGERILEVGCGYGWISEALFREAAILWTGVDRSEAMAKHLRANLSQYNPSVSIADACQLPFASRSFDKILCTGVLMHIADERTALEEMIRVLIPGGLLVCSMNNALSPFCVPVRLHNSLKANYVQNFHLPRTYKAYLQRLGMRITQIHGDGLLVTVPVTIGKLSFPPNWAFHALSNLDQLLTQVAPWLAYEMWFTAVKNM